MSKVVNIKTNTYTYISIYRYDDLCLNTIFIKKERNFSKRFQKIRKEQRNENYYSKCWIKEKSDRWKGRVNNLAIALVYFDGGFNTIKDKKNNINEDKDRRNYWKLVS